MSFTRERRHGEVLYEDPSIYVRHSLIHSPDHAHRRRKKEGEFGCAKSGVHSVKECETIAAAKIERGVEPNEKKRAVESSLSWPRARLGLRTPAAPRLLARPGVERRQILGILCTVLPGNVYVSPRSPLENIQSTNSGCSYAARAASSLKSRTKSKMSLHEDRASVCEAEREAETVQLPRFGKHVDKALFSRGVNSQMSHFSTSAQETCSMCSFVCAGEIHGTCWRPEDGGQIVLGADLAGFSCVVCGPTVTWSRRSTAAMTAAQHDIAVHPKTVIPKSPLKGPQLFHVLSTQPPAIHDQQSFDFETMEIFAKEEKKHLGLLNSPSNEYPQVLRTREPSQANASGEVGSSGGSRMDFRLPAPRSMRERKLSQSKERPRRHGGRKVALFDGFMPIVRRDIPRYSSSVWLIGLGIAHIYSQVLDDVPSTGPQASLNSSVTGSDHASSPESHSPRLAPASLGPSHPRLSSVPDPGAVVGRSEGFIAEKNDALDPPSAIRENIMAASGLPPSHGQSLVESSVGHLAESVPGAIPILGTRTLQESSSNYSDKSGSQTTSLPAVTAPLQCWEKATTNVNEEKEEMNVVGVERRLTTSVTVIQPTTWEYPEEHEEFPVTRGRACTVRTESETREQAKRRGRKGTHGCSAPEKTSQNAPKKTSLRV
ncbi:hypothetical protein H4582DRAFT_2132991 [Lactarius indigo]|nr:hypothetical protein H4582DRAFT_2132991 [Lactarius indigo]